MNRRGFFAGLMAVLGLGSWRASAEQVEQEPVAAQACEHKFENTPYVLVYGEVVIQRGPELHVCKRCGELRVDVRRHREAMMQREYDVSFNAVVGRVGQAGYVGRIDG